MSLREIEERLGLRAVHRDDAVTMAWWIGSLLAYAQHSPKCERNAVVATGDGSEGRGPCTCGLDALLEEIGA